MSIEALIAGLLLFEFPRKFHLPAEQSRTEFRNPIANPLAAGYQTLLSLHTAGLEQINKANYYQFKLTGL